MKSRHVLAMFGLGLIGLPLAALADNVPKAPMTLSLKGKDPVLEDYNFPSGLRVVFQEDHTQPVVSITSVNDRGSTSDPPGKEGIAHVVEHLWFRSHQLQADNVTRFPKIWDLLEEMGGVINAFTADDLTVYMTVAPADKLPVLMSFEGMRMRGAVDGVAADVLTVEREVIRNELRFRYENNTGAVFGQVFTRLFPQSHPYGRTAYAGIGNNDSLNAISIEDVQQFVKENYGPDKTTIFVVGDFKLADASKYLAALGTDLMVDPKNPTAQIALVDPKPHGIGKLVEPPPPVSPIEVKGGLQKIEAVHGPVKKKLVVLAWSTPGGRVLENDILQNLVANGLQNAIYQEINPDWQYGRDKDQKDVECGPNPQKEAGAVFCFIEIPASDDGKSTINSALDGLYHQWEQDENESYRSLYEQYFTRGMQEYQASILQTVDLIASLNSQRVTEAAQYTHYSGSLSYFSDNFNAINGMTSEKVRAFAEKYITRQRAIAVVMAPYEEGDVTTDSSDAVYAGEQRADRATSLLKEEQLTPEFLSHILVTPEVEKITQFTLKNGLKVAVMPYSDGLLVQERLIFNGGYNLGMRANFASANTNNTTYAAVDDLRVASFDDWNIDDTVTTFSSSGSAGNAADQLYVLRTRLDGVLPDTNGRIDWIKARKRAILDSMAEEQYWADNKQKELLFGDHFLGHVFNHGDYDTMNAWTSSQVEQYWSAVLQPANATLLVVGNVNADEVKKAAETYLESWKGWRPGKGADLTATNLIAAPNPPPARTVLIVDRPSASQTQVNYMCQLEPVKSVVDRAASRVLAGVLSQKIWNDLRENTGASYGAYAFAADYPGGTNTMGMESLVQNSFAAIAVKNMLQLGESALGPDKPDAPAIDSYQATLVKYGEAQQYAIGQQSTEQMANRLFGVISRGDTFDYFKTWGDAFVHVTPAQMKAQLPRCVGHEVVTATGPAAAIKPLFDKEGIAVTVIDAHQQKLDYATKYGLKDILKAEEKKKADDAKKAADEAKKAGGGK